MCRCVIRISTVLLNLRAKQATNNDNNNNKKTLLWKFFTLSRGFRIFVPLCFFCCFAGSVMSQALCVLCKVERREGCTEFGRTREGLQYLNQSDVSYSLRSSFTYTSFCVLCFFSPKWWPHRLKQLLWLKLPQGQGELSTYMCFLWKI